MADAGTDAGRAMHDLMARLFPICRSITGEGVRETLRILGEHVPLDLHEVPSGTQAFDWAVPEEWTIRDAYVMDAEGRRVIDFQANNLHVVSYSEPVDCEMDLEELRQRLHTRPDLPAAIPYVTSYYKRSWGFCLSQQQLDAMHPGRYRVRIDSTLAPGTLTYGELRIPGQTDDEILLSTYICHPSMANNELSGPVLTTWLAKALLARSEPPRHSYRILFLPETIGAITYLSRHLTEMKQRTRAGYVVTCVGGPDDFTYLRSRRPSVTDRVTEHVLAASGAAYRTVPFTERASDERQYCAPGVDLPIGSLMRSKYYDYREYHTSLDDLDFVRPEHMAASLEMYMRCLKVLEANRYYRTTVLCEPQLGKRGLYPNLGAFVGSFPQTDLFMGVLAYADGDHDLLDIAALHDWPFEDVVAAAEILLREGLLEEHW